MKKILLIILLFSLTGCVTDNPPNIIGTPRFSGNILNETVTEDINEEVGPQEFSVFYKGVETEFGKYEPGDGVYLGAWLSPETSIRMFEHESEKRHAVYVNEIELGDEIPVSWLLHCIASFATPLFIVSPPENPELEGIHDIDLIIHLAQRLGSFNLPMFVAFYPEHDIMPAEYALLFRQARNAFLTHAPMVAFTWVTPSYNATERNPFYPGHNAVDWVALPLMAEWDGENFKDILNEFDIFYSSFHESKPIMVLPLGVSHYTRSDYTYRLNQAAAEISRVYEELRNYPRLGLIIYADALTLARTYDADFSVTIEPELINAYCNAVFDDYFLPLLEKKQFVNERWVRSAYNGYVWEDKIYISTEIENEILISAPRQTIEINENNFFEARRISEKNISVCTERRVIYVDN